MNSKSCLLSPADIAIKRELVTPFNMCLGCGKHLVGFSMEEHTLKVHGGKDPGYRKVGG